MKKSEVLVGKKYMLSLGRRGAKAVTVLAACEGADLGKFAVVDSTHCCSHVSPRRLAPCPVTDAEGALLWYAHEM